MMHEDPPPGTNPNTRPTPVKSEAAIQEAKRIEKVQALGSAHRTAGTVTDADKAAKPETADQK